MRFLPQQLLSRCADLRLVHPGFTGALGKFNILGLPLRSVSSAILKYPFPRNGSALTISNGRKNERPSPTVAYNSIRWNSSEGIKWLWEASDGIKGFNEGNKHGTRLAGTILTFNSVEPLEAKHFQKALEYLTRQMPNMKSVIRQRGESAWFCQVQETTQDFKVLSDESNFIDHCLTMFREGFKDTDSLPWKVRVVERGAEIACQIRGVREMYPYQYDIFMMINHALTDGMDIIHVINQMHQNLDNLLGRNVISEREIGIFEKNKDFENLVSQRRAMLLQDPSKYEFIKKTLPMLDETPDLFEAFPRPNVSKVCTHALRLIMDPQMMIDLVTKCSEKGVSFNSLCIAVNNVALAELMQEAGLEKESYKIACLIFMNARRYTTSKKHQLGCQIIPLTYMCEVKTNTKDSFWEYCTKLNQELQAFYTTEGRALDQAVVQAIIDSGNQVYNYTDNPRPVCHYYSNTSLGDITKSIPGTGKFVRVTDLCSFQAIHNYRNAILQESFTFNGRTHLNFHYANNYFSHETINLISDKIVHFFNVFVK